MDKETPSLKLGGVNHPQIQTTAMERAHVALFILALRLQLPCLTGMLMVMFALAMNLNRHVHFLPMHA